MLCTCWVLHATVGELDSLLKRTSRMWRFALRSRLTLGWEYFAKCFQPSTKLFCSDVHKLACRLEKRAETLCENVSVITEAIVCAKDVQLEAIGHVPVQGDKILRALQLLTAPEDRDSV